MLVLRAPRLFDGERMLHGLEIVVAEDGSIAEVRPRQDAPSNAEVIDYGGDTTLLPGLVDGHQHLSWGSTPSALEGLAHDRAFLRKQTLGNARLALAAGVTTVQDVGDGDYLVVDVRNEVSGDPMLPRILASGPPITSVGGHCHFLGGSETRPADVAATVREHAERGVDLIKVMASGGNVTPGSLPWDSQFDRETLRAIVTEAARHGLGVAAHGHGVQAIWDSVEAGVASIEHCTFMTADGVDPDPDLRRLLAESGVVIRLTAGSSPGGPPPPPAIASRLPLVGSAIMELHSLGARLVASTDAGVGPGKRHDTLPYALAFFATLGIPATECLSMMTARAADAVGLATVCGRLRAGLVADVLVVSGDPTTDPAALLDVRAVHRAGRLVAGPSSRPRPEPPPSPG